MAASLARGIGAPPFWKRMRAIVISALLFTPAADLLLSSPLVGAADAAQNLDLDFGVFSALSDTQQRKAQKTDPAPILEATDRLLVNLTPRTLARVPPVAPYTVHDTTQSIPSASAIFDVIGNSTLSTGTSIIQFLFQPGALSYAIYTNCSGVSLWSGGTLRPTLNLSFVGGQLKFLDFGDWVAIDCDANPATGVNGSDIQVRLRPVILNISFGLNPVFGNGLPSLSPSLTFLGGISIEVERLGSTSSPLPLELALLKSFSYDNNDYVWFVQFGFPAAPPAYNVTVTSDQVNIQGNLAGSIQNIISSLSGNISNWNYISTPLGPYRLSWHFSDEVSAFSLGSGYARFVGAGSPVLKERTWFEVGLTPASAETAVPSDALLRLDSANFNQSFDYLEWSADRPARLSVQYFDDRENYTYAKATLEDMPTFFKANVDKIGSGPNSTAKIQFVANASIALINYDEYIFLNRDPLNFTYTHTRLENIPVALIVNGTFDIGGSLAEPSLFGNGAISILGTIIDRIMIRIASKLYSIGQTLRAIPNNILNLPDQKGWVSIDLPQGGEIGLLEFWLTSGRYATADGDFVAFYNDTPRRAAAGAVSTSFAGRLQHIQQVLAGFIEETTLTLVTSQSLPLTILFLDSPEDATAVAEIHDLPHEFSLKISGQSLRYAADRAVDWMSYTSVIGPAPGQYTRIYLERLPSFLSFSQVPGDGRIETLANPGSGLAGIGLLELEASSGDPLDLPGDHLLSFENSTVRAVSARVHDISSLRYVQGAGGKVRFTARGGDPFSMVFLNRTDPQNRLESFLNFDPLPSSLDVTLPGSLQDVNPIQLPSLGSIASVVDFSHIIFGIDTFGKSAAAMLAQVGSNLANGIGRFDQNFSFAFDSAANTTLTANISKGNWAPQDEAQWIHGLRSKQRISPLNNSSLDLNAKLYLTGLPHHMDFKLNIEAEVLSVNATLLDFTPAYDYLAIETDSESVDPLAQPKNIRFFTDGIQPHTDIALKVDFRSDLSIGGSVVGNMTVSSSVALQDFYVRLTTNRPRATAVEVLIPKIPGFMQTIAEMSDGISITHRANESVDFVLVRMARGVVSPDASAYAIFHNVPPQADIHVPSAGDFDMSTPNPFKTLPNITMVASEPGLDLVADLQGDALGSRGSLRFLALDLGRRLTMAQEGSAYSIASDGVSRLFFELTGFPISKGLTIDAASIYAENVRSVTISHQLVFNSMPIITVENLNADKLQINFEHRISALSGASKPTTFIFVTVPLGGAGPLSVASNGIVTSRESSGRYVILPAPILSWLVSQF
jgi:hypothetical protein